MVVKYEYDSWGKLISITGTLADTIGVQNPFRYRGYYYDNETGMYYLKSRYYDPEIRRFVSADSQVNKTILGGNLFVYCENNPVNKVDYSGHAAGAIVALVGFLAVLGVSLISNLPSTKESSTNFAQSISHGFTRQKNSFTKSWSREDYQRELELNIRLSFARVRAEPWNKNQKHVHHIVAKKSRKAERGRPVLRSVGIGVNEEVNLVSLKKGFHQRLHHGIYYEWINMEMEAAYNDNSMDAKESVNERLNTLRGILLMLNAASPY